MCFLKRKALMVNKSSTKTIPNITFFNIFGHFVVSANSAKINFSKQNEYVFMFFLIKKWTREAFFLNKPYKNLCFFRFQLFKRIKQIEKNKKIKKKDPFPRSCLATSALVTPSHCLLLSVSLWKGRARVGVEGGEGSGTWGMT